MRPAEALKAKVQELLRTTPSRTAIRSKLLEAGHPDALVEAALDAAFAERRVQANARAEARARAELLEQARELLGTERLRRAEEAGLGPLRAAATSGASWLGSALVAGAAMALGVALLFDPDARALGGLLLALGAIPAYSAWARYLECQVALAVCRDGVVEYRAGDAHAHRWSDVDEVRIERVSVFDDRGEFDRTICTTELRLGGRPVRLSGDGEVNLRMAASLEACWNAYVTGR